jgi:hypothetical protein
LVCDSDNLNEVVAECRQYIKSEGTPEQALTMAKKLAEIADKFRKKRLIQRVKRR